MPHYYIDSDDGDLSVVDDEGIDLPGPQEARRLAMGTLPDMARAKMPDGDRRSFTVSVRDEDGIVLYTASLELVGEWQVTPPSA